MKNSSKKSNSALVYSGSFYVYEKAELALLRRAAKKQKQRLSGFVLSCALREARKIKSATSR